MGTPNHVLVGLGYDGTSAFDTLLQGAGAPRLEIYNAYLVGAGSGDWTTWNSNGTYVDVHAAKADKVNAIPMFTLYQMATNGDGDLSGLSNATFMSRYWGNVRLMFQRLNVYGRRSMVVIEPDFWGYVQQQAPSGDPTQMPAQVSIASECGSLPNNAKGIAACIVQMRDAYAPNAYLGFMVSAWGAPTSAGVASFMKSLGAYSGDFLTVETSDRDAGCFEFQVSSAGCGRTGSNWYWDTTAFDQHFAAVKTYRDQITDGSRQLPIVWWQMPMGVPSVNPGGTYQQYRDNRMDYFLNNGARLAAAGGFGVVFSKGEASQTGLESDGGQYKRLSEVYFSSPAILGPWQ